MAFISIHCPVCNRLHETLPRYKKAVCSKCIEKYKTKDREGNVKEFYNVDIFGGIKCLVDGETVEDYSCLVNNVRCRGEEGRFGGIVILSDGAVPER